ncbi:hypothetical protein HJFPF1_02500 [Paramyrothecium foliicola]|nr:hypothetical protein HJFPF1_02500 [Paramyrothecium foliicola]
MTLGGSSSETSALQHVLALYLREFLSARSKGTQTIACFAQDPIYTKEDRKVLANAGMTVLDDPRGLLEIDETSVVLAIASNIPTRQIVADIARPALIVWDRVPTCTQKDVHDM